jgi:lipopolysaccharide biosynthesis glycosyltransferase
MNTLACPTTHLYATFSMTAQETITLVVVCNNHFAVLLAALLKSLDITHKSEENITLYIVDDGLSTANRAKLTRCISSPEISLVWIKMQDAIPRNMIIPMDNSSFPISAYIRLFAPYFVDSKVEKIIYLDADMILLEDISVLWNVDLQGHVLAAAIDRTEKVSNPWGGIKNYKELGLNPESKYFNSGLLVIDMSLWRKMDLTNKVLECVSNNKAYAGFPDQYGLNVVLAEQWLELDPLWNCVPMSTVEKPFLIHFIGRKPIFKMYEHNPAYKDLFFHYLNQTEWRGYRPRLESSRMLRKAYNLLNKKATSFLRFIKVRD